MQHNHIYRPYRDGHQVDPSRSIAIRKAKAEFKNENLLQYIQL